LSFIVQRKFVNKSNEIILKCILHIVILSDECQIKVIYMPCLRL
jgi:hypothetical protein